MLFLLIFGGCATLPTGPSVRVMPAPGKPFDQFMAEDAICRQCAEKQIGMSPQEISDQNAVSEAAAGTAIGASSGQVYGAEAQRRYDNVYVQCMYSKGNQVPGSVARPLRRYAPSYPPPGMQGY